MKKFFAYLFFSTSYLIASPTTLLVGAKHSSLVQASVDLPDGLVAVEYLEADGNSYIDLGFQQETNYRLAVDCLLPLAHNGGGYPLFGAFGTASTKGTYVRGFGSEAGTFIQGFEPISNRIPATSERTMVQLDTLVSKTLSAYGISVDYPVAEPSSQNINMLLFAIRKATIARPGTRIYRATYESEVHNLDLVPVRDEDNIGYLYDLVSGEVFSNSGTGSFIIGKDL